MASPTRHYVVENRVATSKHDVALANSPGVRVYKIDKNSAGDFNYKDAQMVILDTPAAADTRGQLPPGTVISDGNLSIVVKDFGTVTISGLPS